MSKHPPRHGPRRHRHMAEIPVTEIIAQSQMLRTLHLVLSADGYKLQETTRPYVTRNGVVTLRLVWRARRTHGCSIHQEVCRIPHQKLMSDSTEKDAAE